MQRLKLAESIFFPLVMVVNTVGRAYAADLGLTAEYIRKKADLWKAEQDEIGRELADVEVKDERRNGNDQMR
jgi:hypothetical protein